MSNPAYTAHEGNVDQIDYWNDRAGATWAAQQVRIDATLAPISAAALAFAAPQPGQSVLDIGCGCGTTTLDLMARVGETGDVLGVDVSEPMLAVARERAATYAIAPRFELGDASTYPFEAESFDLLFSRFGVMFFADPTAAFAHLRRAAKPGGRLAFVCWRSFPENEWMSAPLNVAMEHFGEMEQTDPNAPGPFAFADPHRTSGMLKNAGFKNVAIEPFDTHVQIGNPDHEPLTSAVEFVMRVGPLSRQLKEADDALRAKVAETVRKDFSVRMTERGVEFGAACWFVSATA